jgi:hypothetical protein
MRGRLIFVLAVVTGAATVAAVFWGIGKNEKAAGDAGTRFAAALVDNDPAAAPKGAREYIPGVRAYFGAVTGARVIGTHNERADANTDSSRTYPVADLLLRSARGPAVIELAFDNGGIGSEKVTGVYELAPDDAPKLPGRDGNRLALAFAERGGIPAGEDTLKRARRQPGLPKAQSHLRCVQRARGDVTKLLECAR